MKARLFTDGGARGNPGPAAYGYVLEAENGTVLAARLAYRRRGALAGQEGSRPLRVPGAVLVVADAPGPGGEKRLPHRIQRLGRDEDDELPYLLCHQPRLTSCAVRRAARAANGQPVPRLEL